MEGSQYERGAGAELGRTLGLLWDERLSVWQKFLSLLLMASTVVGSVWVFGTAYGAVKADFGDLPDRVDALEEDFRAHLDTTTRETRRQINRNTDRIERLEGSVNAARDDIQGLRGSLIDLMNLAESNHCWIRVAAGDEVRFNCSTTPNGTP